MTEVKLTQADSEAVEKLQNIFWEWLFEDESKIIKRLKKIMDTPKAQLKAALFLQKNNLNAIPNYETVIGKAVQNTHERLKEILLQTKENKQ